MYEFKQSPLCDRLYTECQLDESVDGFLDACSDDWTVEEKIDLKTGKTIYTVHSEMFSFVAGKMVNVTATYSGDFIAMYELFKHLAHLSELVLEEFNRDK